MCAYNVPLEASQEVENRQRRGQHSHETNTQKTPQHAKSGSKQFSNISIGLVDTAERCDTVIYKLDSYLVCSLHCDVMCEVGVSHSPVREAC